MLTALWKKKKKKKKKKKTIIYQGPTLKEIFWKFEEHFGKNALPRTQAFCAR